MTFALKKPGMVLYVIVHKRHQALSCTDEIPKLVHTSASFF
jgi:hypothetical protein